MNQPLIHSLLADPLDGAAIESRSLAAIDREAPPHCYPLREWAVVRRMIHATADFSLAGCTHFSPGAVDAAVAALTHGRAIYVDSAMIRAGLSPARLSKVCPSYSPESILCHVADADVRRQAGDAGLPRSLFAVRKARRHLEGAIAVFGNSPVALLELNRMIIEENLRPSLVIGMPVGFVHVIESKEELMSLDVPWIVVEGRRGGSPLAVAALHALCGVCRG
jgi:precorrin isomerase